MRICLKFLILLTCLGLMTPQATRSQTTRAINVAPPTARRIALVIGNATYQSAPLANPANDAHDMAVALEKCAFDVTTLLNADRSTMRKAIRVFGEKINKGNCIGLFYYAGHGIQVNGENFLVPVKSEVLVEDEVEDECLKLSAVLRKMETAGNSLNIIILDACRSNPFGRNFRSGSMGLARMEAPVGTILAYATAPGSLAADGKERNGLYTSKLLQHLRTEGLEIGHLFRSVRRDVMSASENRQIPWETSSLVGEFYFVPTAEVAKRPESAASVLSEPVSPKLAMVAPVADRSYIELESSPRKLGEPELLDLIKRNNFYDADRNKQGSFPSNLADNGDGTVIAGPTGLMWQKGGSRLSLSYRRAALMIKKLNNNRFAGYSDWRLPTIDELASLLTADSSSTLHINGVFAKKQVRVWSNTPTDALHQSGQARGYWVVDFRIGQVVKANWFPPGMSGWTERYTVREKNYVRAVRSIHEKTHN